VRGDAVLLPRVEALDLATEAENLAAEDRGKQMP
jgi:hypothetical protein